MSGHGTPSPRPWRWDDTTYADAHADIFDAGGNVIVEAVPSADAKAIVEAVNGAPGELAAEQRARLARLDAEYHLFANQAMMRVALGELVRLIKHLSSRNGGIINDVFRVHIEDAEAALDTPPRNCDLYVSVDEARDAFFKVYFGPTDMGFWEMAFVEWLFAARKGGEP